MADTGKYHTNHNNPKFQAESNKSHTHSITLMNPMARINSFLPLVSWVYLAQIPIGVGICYHCLCLSPKIIGRNNFHCRTISVSSISLSYFKLLHYCERSRQKTSTFFLTLLFYVVCKYVCTWRMCSYFLHSHKVLALSVYCEVSNIDLIPRDPDLRYRLRANEEVYALLKAGVIKKKKGKLGFDNIKPKQSRLITHQCHNLIKTNKRNLTSIQKGDPTYLLLTSVG